MRGPEGVSIGVSHARDCILHKCVARFVSVAVLRVLKNRYRTRLLSAELSHEPRLWDSAQAGAVPAENFWGWPRDGTGSPGHGSAGHRVSNVGPGRVGSRVKALTRLFDPWFLFNVVKNCRQSVSFIIVMRYRRHWHVSHKTSSRNFCIEKISVAINQRTDHCPAVVYLFTDRPIL